MKKAKTKTKTVEHPSSVLIFLKIHSFRAFSQIAISLLELTKLLPLFLSLQDSTQTDKTAINSYNE